MKARSTPMTRCKPLMTGVPSPLVGEGQGGGYCRTIDVGVPPTPNPSPQGGGGTARPLWRALLPVITASVTLTPTTALAAGGGEVSPFVYQFMVFVIAIFVGYYVVWSVTPALHTPLMSVTNAISSVIVVGALLAVGVALVSEGSTLAKIFGFLALVMASVNIFGGFLVTQRMLGMYKKREPKR
jgi:H+-translocating NAD(P) transhydrogenase subunit alpha